MEQKGELSCGVKFFHSNFHSQSRKKKRCLNQKFAKGFFLHAAI